MTRLAVLFSLVSLLISCSSISGTVTHNGKPVVGAPILLNGADSNLTRTDKKGNYSFKAPSAGDYRITMGDDCSNASPGRQKVRLRGLMPHQKDVNFQLNDEYQNTSQICDATISTTEGLVKGGTATAADGCKASCVYKGIPYAEAERAVLRAALGRWDGLDDAAAIEQAHGTIRSKYGLQMRLLDFFASLTGRKAKRAWIEITLDGA